MLRPVSPALNDERRAGAAAFVAVFVALLYEIPLRVHLVQPSPLHPTSIDAAIPFVEWTVWIYYSYFVFLFVPFAMCRDDSTTGRAFCAVILNSLIAGVIFLAWPTSGVAQHPTSGGVTGLLWSALLIVDRPANFLPSLHVANTCACALALTRERHGWRVVSPLWALLIAISTLTTKQHFVIDVPTGAALGIFSDWVFDGGAPRRNRGTAKNPAQREPAPVISR